MEWSLTNAGLCLLSTGDIIDCFECNTWEDERCNDPFNYTIHKEDMPPLKPCEGCCVKMVQFIGTKHYQIKRTCTDDFEVNFFMVNHACMTEGHRHGRMCFCEEDGCNHGVKLFSSSQLLLLLLIPTTLILTS
nr:protein quiver-like isoform X2 [Lepeophtheirus salmonis]